MQIDKYARLPALHPRFEAEIARIIAQHNAKAYDPSGQPLRDCAKKTRIERAKLVRLAYRQVLALGYKIRSPHAIKEKHVAALCEHWVRTGLAPRTVHTYFSALKIWAGWLGKPQIVGRIGDRFAPEAIVRTSVRHDDGSWQAQEVDPAEIIAQAAVQDTRMGLYLALQHEFGLRRKESIELRPLRDIDEGAGILHVVTGTKGGRPRHMPIETETQKLVAQWARRVAMTTTTGRIRWEHMTWVQANNRFSYLASVLGITKKKLGITAHGLRRGNLMSLYTRVTGCPTPVEGGALGRIDRETHQRASLAVAEAAGHGRTEVAGAYYGSYGHKLRGISGAAKPRQTSPYGPTQRVRMTVNGTPWSGSITSPQPVVARGGA